MAHWAEIDENNIVTRILVTSNNEPDEGFQWLLDNFGGEWIKTSYNSIGGVHYKIDENNNRVPSGQEHLRYNYAGVGYTYNKEKDAFVPFMPKIATEIPNGQFVLNETTFLWELHPK